MSTCMNFREPKRSCYVWQRGTTYWTRFLPIIHINKATYYTLCKYIKSWRQQQELTDTPTNSNQLPIPPGDKQKNDSSKFLEKKRSKILVVIKINPNKSLQKSKSSALKKIPTTVLASLPMIITTKKLNPLKKP